MKDAREVCLCYWGFRSVVVSDLAFNSMSAAQAASLDLKQHMKQMDRKNPKGVRATGHKDKKAEGDADPSENENENENENLEKDEASPVAPYASSEGEPDGELSEDDDVFQGDFAVPKASGDCKDSTLPKLPAKMQASLDKINREVLDTLPSDLSQCLGCRVLSESV